MTKRECAIVMAYTQIFMLAGDDLDVFYRYVEELMGRPVFTHELTEMAEEIKRRAKADFIELCRTARDADEKALRALQGVECCRDMENPPGMRMTGCHACPYEGKADSCTVKLKDELLEVLKGLVGARGTQWR